MLCTYVLHFTGFGFGFFINWRQSLLPAKNYNSLHSDTSVILVVWNPTCNLSKVCLYFIRQQKSGQEKLPKGSHFVLWKVSFISVVDPESVQEWLFVFNRAQVHNQSLSAIAGTGLSWTLHCKQRHILNCQPPLCSCQLSSPLERKKLLESAFQPMSWNLFQPIEATQL